MKILFISGLYPPNVKGGAELSTHYIAQGLQGRGHDVTVITSGERAEDRLMDGIKVKQLPLNLTAKPLLEQRHSQRVAKLLANAFNAKEFDIIHAHDFRSAQALSELGYHNTIVTARDYAQICGSPNNILADGTTCPGCTELKNVIRNRSVAEAPLLRKPFRIWQYRYNINYRLSSFRKFRDQIFISHAQQEEIAKVQNLAETRTHVVYNPIAPSYLKTQPERAVEKNILFVGTVESYKGVGLLLEAFYEIAKQHNDAHLKIVGTGAQLNFYKQWVAQHGLQYRVVFSGRVPVDRIQRTYDEAAIIVAPHIWVEPFGRTVVEAMARAKVVVASDIGGPREIIQDNKTGLLFKSASKEALVARMDDALKMGELDQRELGQAARAWVANNLTIDGIAAQHEAVYRSILES